MAGVGPNRRGLWKSTPIKLSESGPRRDGDVLAAKDAGPGLEELGGEEVLDVGPHIVIAETAPDAEGGAESGEGLDGRPGGVRVEGDEVAGEDDHVGLQLVDDGGVFADLVGGHVGADVDVGELGDAEALEGGGELREADLRAGGLEVQAAVEEAVGAGDEGRAGDNRGRAAEEGAARRGGQIGPHGRRGCGARRRRSRAARQGSRQGGIPRSSWPSTRGRARRGRSRGR